MSGFAQRGYQLFESDARVSAWAQAAVKDARLVSQNPQQQEQWLRHQKTWFVGVDALPNAADGAIEGVALAGPWSDFIAPQDHWHAAQISVVYKGYPQQDSHESAANHRFRIKRCAAHVDGILLQEGRRYLREPHAFVLGLPLNDCEACPLVVWPESHVLMRDALRDAIGAHDPFEVDLTQAYKAARADVFAKIEPLEIHARTGQSILLHRHLLHGVAPFKEGEHIPDEGRMIAYFRPEYAKKQDWLAQP